jgi:hypothetical protein
MRFITFRGSLVRMDLKPWSFMKWATLNPDFLKSSACLFVMGATSSATGLRAAPPVVPECWSVAAVSRVNRKQIPWPTPPQCTRACLLVKTIGRVTEGQERLGRARPRLARQGGKQAGRGKVAQAVVADEGGLAAGVGGDGGAGPGPEQQLERQVVKDVVGHDHDLLDAHQEVGTPRPCPR